MGLDTTYDCWHGAYSAFSRWRERLAVAAGFEVEPRRWEGDYPLGGVRLDWYGIEKAIGPDLARPWKQVPVRHDGTPEPLIILLAHSDCDGEIQANMCAVLADRLEELIPLVAEEDGGGHIGDYGEKTQKFVDGLRRAAKRGHPVRFH